MSEDIRMYPNLVTPNNPVIFDDTICTGCNACAEVCVMDILMPNPEKGKPPVVLYPDECWYDGSCVDVCPLWNRGAIRLNHPLNQRVRWKDKGTGEHFRLGMPSPPPPVTRPPSGGWDAKAAVPEN